ncbi:MAG TPA: aminotransferase class I/II-fold pyridoxal phosphate-dependent enzyme [Sphingomicrobium sp.]|jgi:dTDP-4-amino-4,6-dideoxygalactose transaminase
MENSAPAASFPLSEAEEARPDLSPRPDERWPFYAEDEIASVVAMLQSGKVNQWTGPEVFAFEQAFEERFGGGRAIALANGSVALDLALRAFGIGPGDEVIVSPRSFVASVSCVRLAGATPVFADVDPDSGNITPQSVAAVLTDRTRAVIPVHLAGWPADVPGIVDAVAGRDIKVIEDCAQAHGAEIGGTSVGNFGDAAAWSFCQDKIISTAGEGGLLQGGRGFRQPPARPGAASRHHRRGARIGAGLLCAGQRPPARLAQGARDELLELGMDRR